MNKLFQVILVLSIMVHFVFGEPQKITQHNGELFIKKSFTAAPTILTDSTIVEDGDTLFVQPDQKASCYMSPALYLHFENSCKTVFHSVNNKIILTLLQGNVFFFKDQSLGDVSFEIYADDCYIVPFGTAAAVKIIPNTGSSTAVIEGTAKIQSTSGIARNVSAGQYCSYNKQTQEFGEVRELSENSKNNLQSLIPKGEGQQGAVAELATQEKSQNNSNQEENQSISPHDTQDGLSVSPQNMDKDAPKNDGLSQPLQEENQHDSDMVVADSKMDSTEEKDDTKKQGKPQWGLQAGVVTVDNQLWTRLALSVDVPIWRFGVCFDLELYLDEDGNFTNKGWNFDSWRDAGESLLGKIRYIRFNHSGDPVFVKVGGLDNVTLGYGFIVNRFTNMLSYPGEKLFGLQFELNKVSAIGISSEILIPDLLEFGDEGGIVAARLAVTPLQSLSIPIVKGISFGGTFAIDINQYAPARRWDYSLFGSRWDKDEDDITDSTYLYEIFNQTSYYDSIIQVFKNNNDYDSAVEHKDQWAKKEYNEAIVTGADCIIPIINTKLLSLDIYGQVAMLIDDENDDRILQGWGFGAPGVGIKLAPFWAQAEYRHIRDRFLPEYFNTYYLKERIIRNPEIKVKEETLTELMLNGIFMQCGFNILDIIILDGRGQYLTSKKDSVDQRKSDVSFDASLSFGDLLIAKIPKIDRIELFYYQTDIHKNLFKKSVTTHWGYTLGVEIMPGAAMIWRTDYGWKRDQQGKWVDDKVVTITAGLSF